MQWSGLRGLAGAMSVLSSRLARGAIFTGPSIPRQLLLQEQCWYFSLATCGLEIRACARWKTTQTDPFSCLDG
jgi:hypothetical protein